MADIRINALATTAASTASDDYIAIDGSANGTRKLNAYSPTFGGNLTVSGTGTSSFASNINVNKSTAVVDIGDGTTGPNFRLVSSVTSDANAYLQIGKSSADTNANLIISRYSTGSTAINSASIYATTTLLSGNLTVSGGTARFQDPTNSYGVTITTAAAKTLVETLFGGSSLGIRVGGSGSDSLTIASTGATIRDNLTVSGGTITSGSGTLTLNSSANTVVLQSAGTTALTLDSSQNATFAGNVAASKASDVRFVAQRTALAANTISQVVLAQGSTLFGASDRTYQLVSNGESATAAYFGVQYWDGSNYNLRLKIDSAGDATFAGTIKPQQAATASAPTYVKGAIYFDTTLNKLRVGGATGWETITSV